MTGMVRRRRIAALVRCPSLSVLSDSDITIYKANPKHGRLRNVLLTVAPKIGIESPTFADSTGEASQLI
jgi:hypothetical protein